MDSAITDILNTYGVKLLTLQPGQAAALPEGFKLQDLEQYLPNPVRTRETAKLRNVADFVDYVNRFKTDHTTVFIAPDLSKVGADAPLATAVIDYHSKDAAQWADHKAMYFPTPSPAYAALCGLDKLGLMAQTDFATQLRDLARFCKSHAPAEILEIVRTMTLTSSGEFANVSDDVSGSVRFGYQVNVTAQVDGGSVEKKLTVPQSITFDVPVFVGGASHQVVADLMYRIPKGADKQVQLGIRLPERKWLELSIVEQLAAQIKSGTKLMVLVGSR